MTTPEHIAVFTRSSFLKMGAFQGISFNAGHYMRTIKWGRYKPRAEAELNRNWVQPVCYILVVCGDRLLRYQRGKRGEESRLHNLYSIGIGGHINDKDGGYMNGLCREIGEELRLGVTIPNTKPVACLKDDTTNVGCVHLGFVHVLRVGSEEVAANCASIVKPQFIPIAEIASHAVDVPDQYESWSQICLQNINAILKKAK